MCVCVLRAGGGHLVQLFRTWALQSLPLGLNALTCPSIIYISLQAGDKCCPSHTTWGLNAVMHIKRPVSRLDQSKHGWPQPSHWGHRSLWGLQGILLLLAFLFEPIDIYYNTDTIIGDNTVLSKSEWWNNKNVVRNRHMGFCHQSIGFFTPVHVNNASMKKGHAGIVKAAPVGVGRERLCLLACHWMWDSGEGQMLSLSSVIFTDSGRDSCCYLQCWHPKSQTPLWLSTRW